MLQQDLTGLGKGHGRIPVIGALVQIHGPGLGNQMRGHAVGADPDHHTVFQHIQDRRDTQPVVHIGFGVIHQHGVGGAQQIQFAGFKMDAVHKNCF